MGRMSDCLSCKSLKEINDTLICQVMALQDENRILRSGDVSPDLNGQYVKKSNYIRLKHDYDDSIEEIKLLKVYRKAVENLSSRYPDTNAFLWGQILTSDPQSELGMLANKIFKVEE